MSEHGFVGKTLSRAEYYEWQREKAALESRIATLEAERDEARREAAEAAKRYVVNNLIDYNKREAELKAALESSEQRAREAVAQLERIAKQIPSWDMRQVITLLSQPQSGEVK